MLGQDDLAPGRYDVIQTKSALVLLKRAPIPAERALVLLDRALVPADRALVHLRARRSASVAGRQVRQDDGELLDRLLVSLADGALVGGP